MTHSNFDIYKRIIEKKLDEYLPIQYPEKIWESMRYSLLAGGKRLRPTIILEVCNTLCNEYEHAIPTACATEMMHVYSLIHDDLPCMDNDDYRRGKLTNHKIYGEAIALLAGDALITQGIQTIIEYTPKTVPNEIILKLIHEYTITAGANGIIAGQLVDIDSENKKISNETLGFIEKYKTGALFKYCFIAGGLLGGANNEQLKIFENLALEIGIAFQIADDILDVTSTKELLGKTPLKDINSNKATYVALYGIDKAKKDLAYLCEHACDTIKLYLNSNLLKEIIENIYTKTL